MRTTSPRQLAIFVALIIAVASSIMPVIVSQFDSNGFLIPLAGSFVIMCVLSFIIVYYTLNTFIFEKINPIYKTIENISLTKEELRKKLEGKDVIQEVNSMVINWARNKTKEIKKLRRLERYRKEFLGNVSHELKTPIFNIQGYVLTLLDGGLDDQEVNREYLERTEKSINRMISIIEDLESISRMETGELKLEYESIEIVQLVKDIYDLQEITSSKYDIELSFDRKYDKAIHVKADKDRITEVLNNLIVNSIYYGNKGGKTIVSFDEMADTILVNVTDDGIGIKEDEIPRLFERFYRTDKSRSRDRGGTGLGLSIVKHIIEAHNQTITVRSTPGGGSSFSFTLAKV